MFKEQLSHYFTDSFEPSLAIETRNNYEFTMAALLIKGKWYAFVENADPSRSEDIDAVIVEEFQAKVVGWRVLDQHQQSIGTLIEYSQGENYIDSLELVKGANRYWLLQIAPISGSPLLKKALAKKLDVRGNSSYSSEQSEGRDGE